MHFQPGHFPFSSLAARINDNNCQLLASGSTRGGEEGGRWGGDNSNKRCLSNTVCNLKSSRKLGRSSRCHVLTDRNTISRFPEDFCFSPETAPPPPPPPRWLLKPQYLMMLTLNSFTWQVMLFEFMKPLPNTVTFLQDRFRVSHNPSPCRLLT